MASKDGSINIDTKIDDKGLSEGVKKVQTKLNDIADSVNSTAEKFSSITVPLAALGGGALKVASDFDGSMAQIKNSMGLTEEQAKALQDTAQNVWKAGFGESLDEVTNSLVQVKQNMKGLDEGEIEQATKNAMTLAKTFDADVNEVTRASGNMMKSFGISSEEAFDLMAKGAQNGLNFSNEMFDNLSEYVPLFQNAGYSAEEMFGILQRGAEHGVYNLDFINDAVKEFGIRTQDGSKTTSDAMKELSKGTQKVWKDFLNGKGTVKDVATAVTKDLKGMKDQTEANELGVALFGTKWEDMGADAIYAMLGTTEAMEGAEGSMAEMTKTQEETFGARFQKLLRTGADALRPLGNTLMDIADRVMPFVIKAVESLAKWFEGLSPHVQTVIAILGVLAAVMGPVLTAIGFMIGAISNIIPVLITVWGWFKKLAGIFKLIKTAMFLMGGPVTIAVGLLVTAALWIWQNWDMVSKWLVAAWEWIKETAVIVWTAVSDFFVKLWEDITLFLKIAWEGIKLYFSTLWTAITTTVKSVWNGIKIFLSTLWTGIKNTVKTIFTSIRDTIASLFDNVWNTIVYIWNSIKNFITTTAKNIWTTIKNKFQDIVDSVGEKMDDVFGTIEDIWDSVMDFFDGIDLYSIGKNIIQGLIDGITKKIKDVKGAISGLAEKIPGWAKDILDIHSPSRVFMEIGEYTGEGLEVGIDNSLRGVLNSAKRLANTAIKPFASQPIAAVTENAAVQATNNRQQKQPAIINLRMGNRDYRTFVNDITETQNLHSKRLNRFRGGTGYAF